MDPSPAPEAFEKLLSEIEQTGAKLTPSRLKKLLPLVTLKTYSVVGGAFLFLLGFAFGAGKFYQQYLGSSSQSGGPRGRQESQAELAGTYSWQWATDDGWSALGTVVVKADGSASLTLNRWMMCESEKKSRSVLLAKERGSPTFEPISDSPDVMISLPVTFNQYDENCNIVGHDDQTIEGRLAPATAYSGRLDYENKTRGTYQGGMILVRSIKGRP